MTKDEKGSRSDMVSVHIARQLLEAEMIKAILEDEGIPAFVRDADLERLAYGAPGLLKGFDVQVCADRAEEALALLERPEGADWTCPKCGEKMDGVFDTCWKCGQERSEET